MSIHIGANPDQIAKSILLPGDPMRAKYIAENILEGAVCFNQVRGMLGFTGSYHGKRVSVMGTGMGMPSHSIYVNELIAQYGVEYLVRVGTCGALQEEQQLGDLVLSLAASTDSGINRERFGGIDFAATADFELLAAAWQIARERGYRYKVGNIFSSDLFYKDDPDWWKILRDYGILGVEMETNALYTLAAKYHVHALGIMTVSDHLVTHEAASSQQREQGFMKMVELALEIVP